MRPCQHTSLKSGWQHSYEYIQTILTGNTKETLKLLVPGVCVPVIICMLWISGYETGHTFFPLQQLMRNSERLRGGRMRLIPIYTPGFCDIEWKCECFDLNIGQRGGPCCGLGKGRRAPAFTERWGRGVKDGMEDERTVFYDWVKMKHRVLVYSGQSTGVTVIVADLQSLVHEGRELLCNCSLKWQLFRFTQAQQREAVFPLKF